MTRLLINQSYLLQGIKKWRSNTNWDQDFHNRFYKRLNRLGLLTSSSWYALVDELVSWSAIRPIPKDVIIQNGLKVIGDIDASIRNLSQTHDLQVTDLSQVEWAELKTIFEIAHAIKNSSTPMFGSKMCHFLLPNLFPIYDSQVGERVGTSDYPLYWRMCRNGWVECCEKKILQKILAKQIGGEAISSYPWATKLAELCCLGGGVQAE